MDYVICFKKNKRVFVGIRSLVVAAKLNMVMGCISSSSNIDFNLLDENGDGKSESVVLRYIPWTEAPCECSEEHEREILGINRDPETGRCFWQTFVNIVVRERDTGELSTDTFYYDLCSEKINGVNIVIESGSEDLAYSKDQSQNGIKEYLFTAAFPGVYDFIFKIKDGDGNIEDTGYVKEVYLEPPRINLNDSSRSGETYEQSLLNF